MVYNKTLIYFPVAKNANSSAKFFLIEHLGLKNKFYFIEDKIPRYKQTKQILGPLCDFQKLEFSISDYLINLSLVV